MFLVCLKHQSHNSETFSLHIFKIIFVFYEFMITVDANILRPLNCCIKLLTYKYHSLN